MTTSGENSCDLIYFDLWVISEGKDRIVGCFSIPENKLETVTPTAIYKYIIDHFKEYNAVNRYNFKQFYETCWGLPIPHILLEDEKAIIISNIHKIK